MHISTDLHHLEQGAIAIEYQDDDFLKVVSFDVPLDFFISANALAALCIACRPKSIDTVHFDFAVSPEVQAKLAQDYGIAVTSSVSDSAHHALLGKAPREGAPEKTKTYLNFSGGVDSLAAYYLCGKRVSLLSTDFGGNFAREAHFFSKWDTKIVKTNFRNKPFIEALDWRFMAAGAILMSDYLGIQTLLWGTVLEASPFWFNTKPKTPFEDAKSHQVFGMAGLDIGQTVTSLGEYATTKIAAQFGRNVLRQSIDSAAAPGSAKLFRKLLLDKIVHDEVPSASWSDQHKPKERSVAGQSFAAEILALYFAQKLGLDFVEQFIMETNEDFRQAHRHVRMDFFEKYNPANLVTTPPAFRARFTDTFERLGINAYTERDRADLDAVREHLSKHFKV